MPETFAACRLLRRHGGLPSVCCVGAVQFAVTVNVGFCATAGQQNASTAKAAIRYRMGSSKKPSPALSAGLEGRIARKGMRVR